MTRPRIFSSRLHYADGTVSIYTTACLLERGSVRLFTEEKVTEGKAKKFLNDHRELIDTLVTKYEGCVYIPIGIKAEAYVKAHYQIPER